MAWNTDMLERFWEKVEIREGDCWLWHGFVGNTGYGRFVTKHQHLAYAHRVSYELHHRTEIPAGKQIDHLCRNRLCVNPDHLDLVTAKVNTNRRPDAQARRESCPQGHPYSGENLALHVDSKGYQRRICIACRNARNAARPRKRATQTTIV